MVASHPVETCLVGELCNAWPDVLGIRLLNAEGLADGQQGRHRVSGKPLIADAQRGQALRGKPDVPRRVIGFELGEFPFDPLEIIVRFLRRCDPFELGAVRRDVPKAGLLRLVL